jgi:hypothetical protein
MTEKIMIPGTTRRALLGVGASSLAAAVIGGTATAAIKKRREPPRFDDPVWNREQSARLEAHTDGRQIYGHGSGSIYGVKPGEAVRALFNFEIFATIRVVRRPDGNYDRMTKELVFYTDPVSGLPMDAWDNPYNGERVKVVDVANDPYNWVIRDWVGPPAMPGVDNHNVPEPADKKPFLLHWTEFGPDTLVVDEGGSAFYPNRLDPVKWPRESAGPMVQATELFRYFIRREDVENPALTHLPHNGVWIRVTPWLPWMLMGQAPGHIMYNGMFTRHETLDYYKPAVLARVRERYPQYMTAPTTWYGPNLSSIEHYALEQKPAPVK